MKVPILFIIFNRPETEIEVFNRIREYQPDRLYVAADGPRANKPEDKERCESARAIIRQVDWPCEIKTLFRDRNLGCGLGVSNAISWFFEQEEFGCIIEDDVLPELDWFAFCEEALPKFKEEQRVMLISSFNPLSRTHKSSASGFTRYANIWGWASWKRAWSHYDLEMRWARYAPLSKWIKHYGLILGLYMRYCCKKLNRSYQDTGTWHTWDYQWNFALFQYDSYALVPYVNLTKNVGIGIGDGTHYTADSSDPFEHTETGRMPAPYSYPSRLKKDRTLSRWTLQQVLIARIHGLKSRMKK